MYVCIKRTFEPLLFTASFEDEELNVIVDPQRDSPSFYQGSILELDKGDLQFVGDWIKSNTVIIVGEVMSVRSAVTAPVLPFRIPSTSFLIRWETSWVETERMISRLQPRQPGTCHAAGCWHSGIGLRGPGVGD